MPFGRPKNIVCHCWATALSHAQYLCEAEVAKITALARRRGDSLLLTALMARYREDENALGREIISCGCPSESRQHVYCPCPTRMAANACENEMGEMLTRNIAPLQIVAPGIGVVALERQAIP